MAMNRTQFRKNLEPGLNTVFGMEYNRHPENWREVFDIESSDRAFEEETLMVGLGGASVKAEGAALNYDSGSEAWSARYHHLTIALAFAITQEADEDGLYGKLGAKYAKSLARSMQYTKEVLGAAVLNNAHSGSYLGGDGVALCSTSHPLQGGGTLSNRLTTAADLSVASLEQVLIGVSGMTDDRGIPIIVNATKLVIPRELVFVAERLMASSLRPSTGDNDINAFKSMSVLPGGTKNNRYLSSGSTWFVRTDCPDSLKHFQRIKMQRGMEGDFNTGNLRYKARERYSFGWTDWRGIFSSGA